MAPPKVKADVGEALVEPLDEVKDESPIRDDLAKRAKVGSHLLEMPAVIRDGEITLGEPAELGVEVEGARLAVAEELCFHGKPGVARRDGTRGDGVGGIIGVGAEDLGLHDAVHARPVRLGSSKRGVGEDVVAEGELADDEEELILPARIVAGDVEDDGDQAPDVLDRHRLHVKVDDGRGFVEQQGVVEVAGAGVKGAPSSSRSSASESEGRAASCSLAAAVASSSA